MLLLVLVLCCAYVEPVRCSSQLLADTTLQRREPTILRPYVKRGHVVIFEFRRPSACRYAYHVNAPPLHYALARNMPNDAGASPRWRPKSFT